MRAIQITETGGPEVMVLRELPTPEPGAGQALVQIEACGVNFIDVYQREGRTPAPLPFIPGQEAAGTVIAVGPDVTKVKVGDRVAWCHVMGAYAEFAVGSGGEADRGAGGVEHAAGRGGDAAGDDGALPGALDLSRSGRATMC